MRESAKTGGDRPHDPRPFAKAIRLERAKKARKVTALEAEMEMTFEEVDAHRRQMRRDFYRRDAVRRGLPPEMGLPPEERP